MNRLGLQSWGCEVVLEDDESTFASHAAADIRLEPEYKLAVMRILVPAIAHVEGLRLILRHELLHIVLADMNQYSVTADKLTRTKNEFEIMQSVWHFCIERSIVQLENMLLNIGWNWEIEPHELVKPP